MSLLSFVTMTLGPERSVARTNAMARWQRLIAVTCWFYGGGPSGTGFATGFSRSPSSPIVVEVISQSADRLPQVTLRKCPAGTGLQIALKSCGALLIRELDNDVKKPWTAINGVRTTAGVVCHEPIGNVGCKTSVVATRVILALEDVYERFGCTPDALQLPQARRSGEDRAPAHLQPILRLNVVIVFARFGLTS